MSANLSLRPLAPRERKLIALLILLALVALVIAVIVTPVLDGFAARAQQRAELGHAYRANEARIAALGAMEAAALDQDLTLRSRLLVAPDADDAGEALREAIEAAAHDTGVQVTASEAGVAGPAGGATIAGWARASLEGTMSHAQLDALLIRLNRLEPPLVIDNLTVNADDALIHFTSDQIHARIEVSAPFLHPRAR